jgi:hypothetical protein
MQETQKLFLMYFIFKRFHLRKQKMLLSLPAIFSSSYPQNEMTSTSTTTATTTTRKMLKREILLLLCEFEKTKVFIEVLCRDHFFLLPCCNFPIEKAHLKFKRDLFSTLVKVMR